MFFEQKKICFTHFWGSKIEHNFYRGTNTKSAFGGWNELNSITLSIFNPLDLLIHQISCKYNPIRTPSVMWSSTLNNLALLHRDASSFAPRKDKTSRDSTMK